jgi:chromosomal replication initiation ATPase DnaA
MQQQIHLCPCCRRPMPERRGVAALAFATAMAVYGVSAAEMRSAVREDDVIKARGLVVWALRSIGEPVSYPVIGRMLGGRDHSTIIHAHRKAITLRLADSRFALACRAIEIAWETEIQDAA